MLLNILSFIYHPILITYLFQSFASEFNDIIYDFRNISSSIYEKEANSTLFISITSGPRHGHLRNAARETWLLPCIVSKKCDYRFFVDTNNITIQLKTEFDRHKDIVFRRSCPLMNRHHDDINYGNVIPDGKHENGTKVNITYLHKYDFNNNFDYTLFMFLVLLSRMKGPCIK